MHLLWLYGIACAILLAVLVNGVGECIARARRGEAFDAVLALMVASALGGFAFTSRRWLRCLDRADTVMRFLEWSTWSIDEEMRTAEAEKKRGTAARRGEREALGPGDQDDGDDEEPTDPAYWVGKLSERLERLRRLIELKAPELVIDNERELVQRAIARLSPTQALSVMRSWPQLRERLTREDGDTEAPRASSKPTRN